MGKPYLATAEQTDQATGHLRQDYEAQLALFSAQTPIVSRFLEAQARSLADGILQKLPQVHFKLPDRVICAVGDTQSQPVPPEFREQRAGGLVDRYRSS